VWRRQDDIDASYRIFGERQKLATAHWMVRFGEDNTLMTFGRDGVGVLTTFHKRIVEAARDLKVKLVGIDTANDCFPGDENKRSQVRQFVQRALGAIAIAIGGAVITTAHPSQHGLQTGEGASGSGGWSASFRSRLFFRYPEITDGEQRNPDMRVLERRKANYASVGDEIPLLWRAGCFEPAKLPKPGTTETGTVDATTTFLDLLHQFEGQNRIVSDNSHAGNYAPRMFGGLPRDQRRGFKEANFKTAMNVLFGRGAIANVDYGRKGDERKKIIARPS
jgi:RecA-family ATPase